MSCMRKNLAIKNSWQPSKADMLSATPVLIIIAWAVWLLQTVYPGRITGDSTEQYLLTLQERYADWHPPIMSYLMHHLQPLGYAPTWFYILNFLALTLGVWLIATYYRRKSLLLSLLVALICPLLFNPLVIRLDTVIKDLGLLAGYVLAFGIGLWVGELKVLRFRIALMLIGLTCIFYGTALRHNAIFSAFVLIAFFIHKWQPCKRWYLHATAVIVVWLSMLFSIHMFNYSYLGAKKEHAFDYNMTSDVMAIETLANTRSDVCGIFGDNAAEAWQRYVFRPEINQIVRLSLIHRGARPDLRAELSKRWRYCLLNYPKEYLVSRIAFFMQTLNLGSSPAWFNRILKKYYPELPMQSSCQSTAQFCRVLIYMIPIAAAIVLWIVMAFRSIFLHQKPCERSDSKMNGFFSLSVAVFYFAPYFFFAVSPGILHYYWPCIFFGSMGCMIIVWSILPSWARYAVKAPDSGVSRNKKGVMVCVGVIALLVNCWGYNALCTQGEAIDFSPALRGIVHKDKLTLFAKYPEIVPDDVRTFYVISLYSDQKKRGEYIWDLVVSTNSTTPQVANGVGRALYSRGAVFSRYWGARSTVIDLSSDVRHIEIQQRKRQLGVDKGESIINAYEIDVACPGRAEKEIFSGAIGNTRLKMTVDYSIVVDGLRGFLRLVVMSDTKIPDTLVAGVRYGLTIRTPQGSQDVMFRQDTNVYPTLAGFFSQRTLILDQVVNGSLSETGNTITKVFLLSEGGRLLFEQTLNVPIIVD